MQNSGLHFPNGDISADELARLLKVGARNYVLLDVQAKYLPQLRAHTDGILLVRDWVANALEQNPVRWAEEVAARAAIDKGYTDHRVFANELNLPSEGGKYHDNPEYAAKWQAVVAGNLKQLCPWLKVHAAAYSPGVNGWERYYEALQPYARSFDYIDVHAYGGFNQMMYVLGTVAKLLPDSRLFVSELNGAGTVPFFKVLEMKGIPGCYFIWRWINSDLPGWDRDLMGSPLEGELTELFKEEMTMPVAVAIIPSNQDKNKSPYRPDYSEYGGLHWLSPLVTDACTAAGLNALDFQTRPESQDTFPLENLIAQQERANTWLTQQPEQVKLLVNMHTDSGTASHTYGIYASSKGGDEGKRLAFEIGKRVHEVLATASFTVLEKLGSIDYNTYVFAAKARAGTIPVLIELCSHQNQHDIETFAAHPREVAKAIADGICAYAGVVAASSDIADLQNRVNDLEGRLAKIKEIAAV